MKGIIVSLVTCVSLTAFAFPSINPIGETAYYEIDVDPARTSSLILGGWFEARVTNSIPESDPPAYQMDLDYEFSILFLGTQSGTETLSIEAEFFTEEFLEQLRNDGTYVSDDFKIEHMGYVDAAIMGGNDYQTCDLLRFYEIRTGTGNALFEPLRQLLIKGSGFPNDGRAEIEDPDIKDLEVLAHVCVGIPVLGAVKLDASGTYEGIFVTVGADYDPSVTNEY